jgi:anaerobic ribonucleoside-triphosphate reductase activating protein
LPRVDGITLTGGEPSDQAEILASLLHQFRSAFPSAEVVLYSALLWPRLQQRHAPLINLCDVVIAGPYVASLPPTPLAGSSNQTLHLLTPLANQLYAGWESWPLHRVQVGNLHQDNKVLMVGIPSRAMGSMPIPSSHL